MFSKDEDRERSIALSVRKNIHRNGIKAAVFTVSFIQMAANAVTSVLADIAISFPDASASTVQFLMTFPNLLVVCVSFLSAKLVAVVGKKWMAASGMAMGIMAGICSYLFHGSLRDLFICAGMLGVGCGMSVPVAVSLISDYFEGKEKDMLLGYQTTAANAGSMLMTFLGGILAVNKWYHAYLVYLLLLPGLILTLIYVPGKSKKLTDHTFIEGQGKNSIAGFAWKYFLIAAVFMMLFYIAPTNLSMLVEERGLGTAATVGMAATVLLIGASFMGIFFGAAAKRIKEHTITAGFLILSAACLLIYKADNMTALYLGCFMVGSSNALVLPQCMSQVAGKGRQQGSYLMSLVFSFANLGTFFAPGLTVLAQAVTRNELAEGRFLFAGVLASLIVVLLLLYKGEKVK